MAVFDWKTVLGESGIEYVERGANVARNNINIHCPWCGDADPSYHLGISLAGEGWGCWRDPNHRGRAPWRLLFKLLGDRATRYLPKDEDLLNNTTPAKLASRFATTPQVQALPLEHWQEAINLRFQLDPLIFSQHPFLDYLRNRGIDLHSLPQQLCGVRYGMLAWRILCPIHWPQGELRGWTGRAIGKITPRYLTGPGPVDFLNVVHYPAYPTSCILVEGYFDALRLAQELSFAKVEHVCVVATHGTSFSTAKQQQVRQLASQLPLVWALDADAIHLSVKYALAFSGVPAEPPPHRKDLGESTPEEISQWIKHNCCNSLQI